MNEQKLINKLQLIADHEEYPHIKKVIIEAIDYIRSKQALEDLEPVKIDPVVRVNGKKMLQSTFEEKYQRLRDEKLQQLVVEIHEPASSEVIEIEKP